MAVYTQDGPYPGSEPNATILTPYSKLRNREEDAKRETVKLPLEYVNWELYARESEIGETWPSVRFDIRDTRIALYEQLYRGNIGPLIVDQSYRRVFVNWFGRCCDIMAKLLTSAEIMVNGVEVDDAMLQNIAADLIIDQIRYGGALLRTTLFEGEPFLQRIDPSCWYPTMDGGHVLSVPYTSDESDSPRHDRIRFTIIREDGSGEERIYTYGGERRSTHKLLETNNLESPMFVTKILMSPHTSNDFWGTSKFDDLSPVLLEQTIRLTSYSKILNAHENPMLNRYISESELPEFAGTTPAESLDPDRLREVANQAKDDWRAQNTAFSFDSVAKSEYLTWDGQLVASNFYLDRLEKEISMLTGIPEMLADGQEVPSGIALKRMFTILYAQSLAIKNDTQFGLETGLNALYENGSITIEWPHFFDELSDDLEMMEDQSPFMMEEEDGSQSEEI